jgi:hypothetical protein
MKSRTLFATAVILLMPLVVLAFQTQAEHVRKDDLKIRPFTQGPLKITFIPVYGDGRGRIGRVNIEVKNTSDDFVTFDPRRLSFIDKEYNQENILWQVGGAHVNWALVAAGEKKIGPKARIKHTYALTNTVQLPARLYYEDKLLATIIE